MKTLLDVADQTKLSASCTGALRQASTDTLFHALLRPIASPSPSPSLLSPEPIDDAIRSAEDTFGQGPKLLKDLQARLEARSESLRPWLLDSTPLWLADALSVRLTAGEIARLSHRRDLRLIDIQPTLGPARRSTQNDGGTAAEALTTGLHLDIPTGSKPKIGLIDASSQGTASLPALAEASFDDLGRPCPDLGPADPLGEAWHATLSTLIPDAHWLRAGVFNQDLSATFAQVVTGLQWTLEMGADLVILDLGEAVLNPIWHLPLLNCTLNGTSVVIAGTKRNQLDRELWPIHIPLAGCYHQGPLRTDLLISGAPLGEHRLSGSLAAAARAAAAITLIQTVAPQLQNDPAAIVGPLFAGPKRGLATRGEIEVELDPASILKAISTAA